MNYGFQVACAELTISVFFGQEIRDSKRESYVVFRLWVLWKFDVPFASAGNDPSFLFTQCK